MAWDENYRPLKEGEIVSSTDEILDDHGNWIPPKNSVGQPAPDPGYTSHRQFRRRLPEKTFCIDCDEGCADSGCTCYICKH
jgi:hypothetical protein